MINYKEIEVTVGSSIYHVHSRLTKDIKKNYCTKFNDIMLYSTDSLDGMFLKVTGQTKQEFEDARKQEQLDFKRKDLEHKYKIPELTKEWVENGKKTLTKDKWSLWEEMVPIRLGDLYKGMELGCCLEILEILKTNNQEKAKQSIYDQGHSGMSFGLVCSMLYALCEDKDKDFVKALR